MQPNPLTFAHPCFSNEGCAVSRMHLAVAPKCNIKCSFCQPTVSPCVHGCTPGTSRHLLTPQEAVDWVRQVREAFPKIHICLSTNGLLLPQSVALICQLGVETLTVTINAATPKTGAQIYEHVMGLSGEAGAELLLARQWEGVRMAVAAGLVVKINSVFVPGINDGELAQIAERGRQAGANIQNILPLIPRDRFAQRKRPDQCQLHQIREEAGRCLEQFVRCRHCRADAVIRADQEIKNG